MSKAKVGIYILDVCCTWFLVQFLEVGVHGFPGGFLLLSVLNIRNKISARKNDLNCTVVNGAL